MNYKVRNQSCKIVKLHTKNYRITNNLRRYKKKKIINLQINCNVINTKLPINILKL